MKEDGNNTHQKAYWMLGIALIIFLILLGGSLIGMQMIRNNIEKTGGIFGLNGKTKENYEVLADGTKVNTSAGVTQADIEKNGVLFNNFSIEESELVGVSGDVLETLDDIDITIQNTTEETIQGQYYIVGFYDAEDNLLSEFSIRIEKLEPGAFTSVRQTIAESVVNAARVDIRSITLGLEEE